MFSVKGVCVGRGREGERYGVGGTKHIVRFIELCMVFLLVYGAISEVFTFCTSIYTDSIMVAVLFKYLLRSTSFVFDALRVLRVVRIVLGERFRVVFET